MEDIENVYDELTRILRNLKKTTGRPYTEKTIREKLDRIQKLKEQFELLLEEQLDEKNKVGIRIGFNKTYGQIRHLLNEQLGITDEERIEEKMATFNIELALKAIPTFNGQHKELEPFLTIVQIIYDSLVEDSKSTLIKFILSVKIESNVRTALSTADISTFTQLQTELRARYRATQTIQQVHTSLSSLVQGNMSVETYKNKILSLINDLNQLNIENLGTSATETEKQAIMKSNDSYALTIFKNGLRDNIRQTIFAAQPKTLTEATTLALEVDKSNTNQIAFVRYNNNYNSRNNNNNNRGNENQNRNRGRSNFNSNNRRGNYNNQRGNNNNNNNNTNRNQYGNGNNGNNYRNNTSYRNNQNQRVQNNYNGRQQNRYNNNTRRINMMEASGNVTGQAEDHHEDEHQYDLPPQDRN